MMKKLPYLTLPFLTGCAVSPSVPILGAFFPAWLLCLTAAIFGTLIIRAALIKLKLADRLGPPLVVYPLITVILTFVLWIMIFQN